MKAQTFGVAAILLSVSIGGGVLGLAAIGSAAADWHNIGQPRFHATARCEDGTWSWNKDTGMQGACAYHGGVAIGF
jgi:hypothetical protein